MKNYLYKICILSVFSAAALHLTPEGGTRRIVRILCSFSLLALIFSGVHGLDIRFYAVELAKHHEREAELSAKSGELRDNLSRVVMEREYASYIESKAEACGIRTEEVWIGVRWSAEGLWIPESSRICLDDLSDKEDLCRILEGELGIPVQRQEWVCNDIVERAAPEA